VADVGQHLGVQALGHGRVAGGPPQRQQDAGLAEVERRHDLARVRLGPVGCIGCPQQGHRVGALQLHGPGLLQMPQRPGQAGAAQVQALEAARRGVAFLVLRVHGPVAPGPAAALDVVDDVLQGGAGLPGVPGVSHRASWRAGSNSMRRAPGTAACDVRPSPAVAPDMASILLG
jgi:hypothetical protein